MPQMPRIADYLIISDSKISISRVNDGGVQGGFSEPIEFTVENTAHLGSRSVLSFVVLAPDISGAIQFEVLINNSQQLSYTLGSKTEGTVFSLQEVINANVLRHGTNSIHFHPMSGFGHLEFGDIVLMYQRDI
jgi:hypothetical protein